MTVKGFWVTLLELRWNTVDLDAHASSKGEKDVGGSKLKTG